MIETYDGHSPAFGEDVFVAHSAMVLGKVSLGTASNVWYGSVIRGDVGQIAIGARTNIQDLSMVHVTGGKFDTHIGDDVTVGHHVVLHGCTIGSHVLIGMGAIVLDGATIGDFCLIGAGSLVTPGTVIPPESRVMGSPARVVGPLRPQDREVILQSPPRYMRVAQQHALLPSQAGCLNPTPVGGQMQG